MFCNTYLLGYTYTNIPVLGELMYIYMDHLWLSVEKALGTIWNLSKIPKSCLLRSTVIQCSGKMIFGKSKALALRIFFFFFLPSLATFKIFSLPVVQQFHSNVFNMDISLLILLRCLELKAIALKILEYSVIICSNIAASPFYVLFLKL